MSLTAKTSMNRPFELFRHASRTATGLTWLLLSSLVVAHPSAHAGTSQLVDYSDLVADNAPSVVYIMVHQNPLPQKTTLASGTEQGSGFIFDDANGYILTNAHVVANAEDVTVTLTNHHKVAAKIIGADERTDLAVLQIDTAGLKAVRVGDSDATRIGEPVVAIGAPFGFELTVTAGILSAHNRTVEGLFVPFLQIDAAVNPGNSGGPLFNRNGEVIGVNSRIYSQSGGFTGLAFAIPSNLALPIARELISHGKVEHPQLGLNIQDVTPELARAFGAPSDAGALVVAIAADGPAQGSGVAVGDIILEADDRELRDSIELPRYIDTLRANQIVRLVLWRNGRRLAIGVKLESADPGAAGSLIRAAVNALHRSPPGTYLQGLTVRALGPEESADAGLEGGLVVTAVQASSPAQRAGLKVDDVLLREHANPLASVKALRAAWADPRGETPLLVERSGEFFYVLIALRPAPPDN
jgi:serine protease Do